MSKGKARTLIEETLTIPSEDVAQALREYGYAIPNDAKLVNVHETSEGSALRITWNRHGFSERVLSTRNT